MLSNNTDIFHKFVKGSKQIFTKFQIWDFHGREDSSRGLLGNDTLQGCGGIPTFRSSMPSPSSGWCG